MFARRLCVAAMLALPMAVQAQSADLRITGSFRPSGSVPAVGSLDLVVENVGPTTAVAYLNIGFPQRPPPACHAFGPPPNGAVCRLNTQLGGLCALQDPQACIDLGTFAPGARLACTLGVTQLDPACPPLSYRFVVTNGDTDATPLDNVIDIVIGLPSPSSIPGIGAAASLLLALAVLAIARRRGRRLAAP